MHVVARGGFDLHCGRCGFVTFGSSDLALGIGVCDFPFACRFLPWPFGLLTGTGGILAVFVHGAFHGFMPADMVLGLFLPFCRLGPRQARYEHCR